jgi:hypothetical protein
MKNNVKLVALACADLHLSLEAPACRADTDWLAVQARYLQQLEREAQGLPILCAGDIFDRWNPPTELIYFALVHLPKGMWCVPGQHDLPYQRLDLLHRSGYGVLVEAGKIYSLLSGPMPLTSSMQAYGFGWEETITPPSKPTTALSIAVVHRYCWESNRSRFPDAPEQAHINAHRSTLGRHYHLALFGDNHIPFTAMCGECRVENCGVFIRRKHDEIKLSPSVVRIYSDGSTDRLPLDTSMDLFRSTDELSASEAPIDMREFLQKLESLKDPDLDFRLIVRKHIKSQKDLISPQVREILLTSIE